MKYLFGNQFGFSLVQGMIMASVVAGASLVATRLITDQKLAQKGAETRDQIEDLNNTVFSVLQNRHHCKQTMVANGLALALSSDTSTKYPLTTINTVDDVVVQAGSIYMKNNVKVGKIELMPQIDPGHRNLEITYERLNAAEFTKVGYGAKSIKKTFTMRIQKNPIGGEFTACYSVTKEKEDFNGQASQETGNDVSKEFCNELNNVLDSNGNEIPGKKLFEWDEDNSICRPSAKCPADKIYTGFDSTGSAKCREIRDWMNFNELIDSTPPADCPVGSAVKLEITTNKVKINCTPPPPPPPPPIDCSLLEVYPDMSAGCTGAIVDAGTWADAGPGCECRDQVEEYLTNCTYQAGTVVTTYCRSK